MEYCWHDVKCVLKCCCFFIILTFFFFRAWLWCRCSVLELDFMVNHHFLKRVAEKLVWVCKSEPCMYLFTWIYLCKCVYAPVSVCILHLWPWSNIHNGVVVPSLLIMLRAPNVAWSLVCFRHRSGSSVACSHSLSFSSLKKNGEHFSVDLTSLM